MLQALNYKEYVGIESKKHDLFLQRIEFICMANCLKQAMARESGYKQLKRYLVNEWGMSDADAQHDPDKYNEGSRIYHKFPVIVNNCAQCPNLDIRNLTVNELSLATNLSWVIRRSTMTRDKRK